MKPLELLELNVRLSAVVLRHHGRSLPQVKVGTLTVDHVPKSGLPTKEILLKPKEFDILLCIAQRYPAIVSSEEISNTFSKAKNRLSDKKGQDIDCHEQFRC